MSKHCDLNVCCGFLAYNDRALCRCGIRIQSARNRCPAFAKDKCLEPMFGDVGQAGTNAAMLLLMIATTSSRTCTKPTVRRCFDSIMMYNKYFSKILNAFISIFPLPCQTATITKTSTKQCVSIKIISQER